MLLVLTVLTLLVPNVSFGCIRAEALSWLPSPPPQRWFPEKLSLLSSWSSSRKFRGVTVLPILVSVAFLTSPPASSCGAIEWTFPNGKVQLDDVVRLRVNDKETVTLREPRPIGSGGGGAVFAFREEDEGTTSSSRDGGEPIKRVLKVSWTGSAASVRKECEVLQYLETKWEDVLSSSSSSSSSPGTQNDNQEQTQGEESTSAPTSTSTSTSRSTSTIERCLGEYVYPAERARSMILLEPYVSDVVSSVDETQHPEVSVREIVETTVRILAANTVVIDVQPLFGPQTGHMTLIDFSEAALLSSLPSDNANTKSLVSAFVTEMFGLIPSSNDTLQSVASRTLTKEVIRLRQFLSAESMDVLLSQSMVDVLWNEK